MWCMGTSISQEFYVGTWHMIKMYFSAFTDDQTTRTFVFGQRTVIFKSIVSKTNGLYIDRSTQYIEKLLTTLAASRRIKFYTD